MIQPRRSNVTVPAGKFYCSQRVEGVLVLAGDKRRHAISVIKLYHYTQSVSAGKTHYMQYEDCIISFSIPANKNIGKFLLGRQCKCWELSRMWAPDGHEPNLLTESIGACVDELKKVEPGIDCLVCYADPNAGHEGGVYRAASWLYTGRSEEVRYYVGPNDEIAARRRFHSGKKGLRKAEIEALGYTEAKLPGKHRFARGLTRRARKELARKFST